MKITSEQIDTKLTVDIDDVKDASAVVEIIEGCASGDCACSTDEYKKVESIEILPGVGKLQLKIDVLPGEVIDPACISECLAPVQE